MNTLRPITPLVLIELFESYENPKIINGKYSLSYLDVSSYRLKNEIYFKNFPIVRVVSEE